MSAEDFDIDQIRGGNTAEFEALFRAYYRSLVHFATRYTRNTANAEEIVQDVFADLWANRKRLQIKGSFKNYLYKLTQNKTLNMLKHEKVMTRYNQLWMMDHSAPEIHAEQQIVYLQNADRLKEALQRAVEALPDNYKLVYCLHRVDGLSYPEIAEVLGMSVKNVEYLLTKALFTLRETMEPYKDLIP
jgi:RNA polymerase sigma-70 factor, ECF subfamily